MERVLSILQPPITSHGDGFAAIRDVPDRLVGRLFGCWHRRLSWPITRDRQTYRACLCRSFDPKTWQTFGPFYRPE